MLIRILFCAVFLCAILWTDIRSYKIKNYIVLPALAAGIVLNAVEGNVLSGVLGMMLPLVLLPLFALKMLGAGDIKALCALGAILGVKLCGWLIVFTFLSGGVIALVFLLFQGNAKERLRYLGGYIRSCFIEKRFLNYSFGNSEKSYFRFAYAIAAGTVITFLRYFLFR